MAKGDDAIRKKKNKANRKKLRKESTSQVSARVAAIIASKQRRKSGKRRMCEGMCFSLPTPEDPFNDGQGPKALDRKKAKTIASSKVDAKISRTEKGVAPKKNFSGTNSLKVEVKPTDSKEEKIANKKYKQSQLIKAGKTKEQILGHGGLVNAKKRGFHGNLDCPSKFLNLCLNAIQNALLGDGTFNADTDRPLLFNMWGIEFWKCCLVGSDILETTGAYSSIEQIAWMVSSAADIITSTEKGGLSVVNPFLLILVPSQEKAIKVRSVCKPLKALGLHTVSVHPGALLDHQIHGLKSCEPEFLVSTPERLLELVSLKAIDISKLSILVIDGSETFVRDGLLDKIKSIRQSISGDPLTIVFNDSFGTVSTSAVRNLLEGPICRLSLSDSIASQSACISQSVHVCVSEEKLSKGIQILNQEYSKQLCSERLKVLFVAGTSSKAQALATAIIAEGYSISNDAFSDCSEVVNSKDRILISVTDTEHVGSRTDMGEFEIVIIIDFSSLIDDYVRILTKMARETVNGVLHTFFCQEDAPLAGPLIEILEQCGQTVPQILKDYHDS